jgi:hypothetical protein
MEGGEERGRWTFCGDGLVEIKPESGQATCSYIYNQAGTFSPRAASAGAISLRVRGRIEMRLRSKFGFSYHNRVSFVNSR